MRTLETDIAIIGAGGAGMAAAIAASEAGSRSILIDRSLIGRGGATVMAQMTVAAAVGEQTEDHWTHHLKDTLAAGRGLCDERLARLLCEEGVTAIRRLQDWKVGWAAEDGHLKQVQAPGHDRPRCVYVDFLNTGPAVSKTLRTQVIRHEPVRRVGDLYAVDIVQRDGAAVGVLCLHLHTGEPVLVSAPATIIATGGLTRLYRRNSASLNMGGDGYALALRAGASLIDMEFVQFFPIGHLAPRLIGMDPIMWDPFRYKLGGRLLNGNREEFTQKYGVADGGRYQITRDQATYAITKEVEAGRGSPAGGAYLSFEHVPESELRKAFGPIIDKLAKNGIDLTRTAIEVAPIAHYHMGGVQVGPDMETEVPNLYCAGEAVGGANGANRLSGNAITEALAFGFVAGRSAASRAKATGPVGDIASDAAEGLALLRADGPKNAPNSAALIAELQDLMQDYVGPFRTAEKLAHALAELRRMKADLGAVPFGSGAAYDPERLDWLDLRTMLTVAEAVTLSAQARTESRGAHQREDHPGLDPAWELNQIVQLKNGGLSLERRAVIRQEMEAAS
ncbi:FAD-binding protein [Oceanibaculum indicum]|uniref:Succinate dehydrogenase flavoprotein subunit n=1 Tax=Oceanibaculum indicum P24 TaxID=1207063 RepID=K2JK16_9PROT|nr:FAD-binding protein [Oceanibaculum indicum]EKE74782.1 succinate dehydrogenase flavoprotein subunit [Oceanibaculum indicum P24]